MARLTSVTVVGSITRDHILTTSGQARVQVGGVPVYAGLTLARKGVRVTVVANAPPRIGAALEQFFDRFGIRMVCGVSEELTSFRLKESHRAERELSLLTYARPVDASQVEMALDESSLVYLGPLHDRDLGSELFSAAMWRGHSVAIDLQGAFRSTMSGPVRLRETGALRAARGLPAYAKASAEEMASISAGGSEKIRDFLRDSSLIELLVTSGASGGGLFSQEGAMVHFAAKQVADVDTTVGAGDVFFASYLYHRLLLGLDAESSLGQAGHDAAEHVEGKAFDSQALSWRWS